MPFSLKNRSKKIITWAGLGKNDDSEDDDCITSMTIGEGGVPWTDVGLAGGPRAPPIVRSHTEPTLSTLGSMGGTSDWGISNVPPKTPPSRPRISTTGLSPSSSVILMNPQPSSSREESKSPPRMVTPKPVVPIRGTSPVPRTSTSSTGTADSKFREIESDEEREARRQQHQLIMAEVEKRRRLKLAVRMGNLPSPIAEERETPVTPDAPGRETIVVQFRMPAQAPALQPGPTPYHYPQPPAAPIPHHLTRQATPRPVQQPTMSPPRISRAPTPVEWRAQTVLTAPVDHATLVAAAESTRLRILQTAGTHGSHPI